MNLKHIEERVWRYSQIHQELTTAVDKLEAQIKQIKAQQKAYIISLASQAAEYKSQLIEAIEAHPELFEKPRSKTLHGIKFGLQKQKGRVVIDDPAKTIQRIRDLLPSDQAELLITVRESVHKPSVADLTAADLKRLGIKIEADTDKPVVKAITGDIEKLINSLIDTDEVAGEARNV